MTFQIGQLVRVARQPGNMLVHIQGEVAFIDTLKDQTGETWASIQALRLDGGLSGAGSVPVSCLDPCTEPVWLAAYEVYRQNWARRMEELQSRIARHQAAFQEALRLTAEEHRLSVEMVEKVVRSFDARRPD